MSSSFLQQRNFLSRTRRDRASGFTLIEVLTVVAIIAILFAIAMPQYTEYVRRSASAEGPAALSDARVRMEQYYLDNRTYSCAVAAMPYGPTQASTNGGMQLKNFTFVCPAVGTTVTATTYTLEVIGQGQVAGQSYTIDQSNNKQTVQWAPTHGNAPAHATPASCWLVTGGEC